MRDARVDGLAERAEGVRAGGEGVGQDFAGFTLQGELRFDVVEGGDRGLGGLRGLGGGVCVH